MKQLLKWDRQNPMWAKRYNTPPHLLVFTNVLWLGMLIFPLDWGEFPKLLLNLAHLLFLPFLCIPIREESDNSPFKDNLKRQKSLDFKCVLSIIIITFGINYILTMAPSNNMIPTATAGIPVAIRTDLPVKESLLFKTVIKNKVNKINKWINKEIHELKQLLKSYDKKNPLRAEQVFLIILTIIVGVFLSLFLIFYIAASLLSTTSTIVELIGLLGIGLIILLCALAIKGILKLKDPKIKTNQ